MSNTIISTLATVGQNLTLYLSLITFIGGILGGILTIIVFASLQTFRQSSCAFYLTIISLVNIGQLFVSTTSRILATNLNIDWSLSSLFYCKFRLYFLQVCGLTSMTCCCLATIDQYFATCSRVQWQRWCNIKLAYRLVFITILFWILHHIPYLIFYNHILLDNKIICKLTNLIFEQYTTYANLVILGRFIPISITFLFGYLAYRNVQQISYRTVPIVRRQLDQQLTSMVLVQVLVSVFTVLPNAIVYPFSMIPSLNQDPVAAAQIQFMVSFTICLLSVYQAVIE